MPSIAGKQRQHRFSPSLRVIILALVSALAISLYTTWSLVLSRHQVIEEAYAKNQALADLLEEHALRVMGTAQGILEAIADDVASGAAEDPLFPERLKDWTRYFPEMLQVWVVDSTGIPLATSIDEDVTQLDLSQRNFFLAHTAGEKYYVTALRKGAVTGTWLFSVSRRLETPDGHFLGVAAVSIGQDYFEKIYTGLNIGPRDNVLILRADGSPIAIRQNVAPRSAPPSFTDSLVIRQAARSPEGRYELVAQSDGVHRVGYFRRVTGWPLVVASSTAKDDALAAWRETAFRQSFMLIVGLCSLALLTCWGLTAIRQKELSLEQRSILLNEIHHRVKNNLAIIQSLLQLEASRVPETAQGGYEDSLTRVQAMALVHEILYQSDNFAALDGGEYIRRLCDVLGDTAPSGITISAEADSIILSLDQAMPLALLVNEAVANAVKHAFPHGRGGMIKVAFFSEKEVSDKETLVLEVRDNGQGFSEAILAGRSVPGLGLRLIKSLAAQLEGKLLLANQPEGGALIRLRFSPEKQSA
ncbi:sensor histidine kinase [Telmatospirillum sp. J64-1]|uniref:sensor histidine kinase n=1 Tax=Telmatospirillum sp. J64-1 TaxID=2502183 RepID=UPI00163D5763|nr:histidine kinase dimerization/phosphoacceptor domain -containing protein [Telmatospirillum sp. J64-1]